MRWLPAVLSVAACAAPEPAGTCSAEESALLVPADAGQTDAVPSPPPSAPPAPAPWQPAPPAAMTAPPVEPPAPGAVVAPPSQATRAVAALADGSAAVSVDVAGNVRLWPTLDGSREPVVVAMRRPVVLAITRGGSDVVIAGVDGAGQLELAEVGALGEPRWRKPVELPRPVIDLRATETGFLVETDDQRLAFVDLGARLEGEVEPPPGADIAGIAVSRDRMLALLSDGGAVRGRWLVVGGELHWGDDTAALPIAPRAIALSPDSTMLAGIVDDAGSARLAILGIEHADLRAVATADQAVDPSLRPVRWLDDSTVLTTSQGQLLLWHIAGGALAVTTDLNPGPAAIAGGDTAIIGAGSELMLLGRNGTTRFLGFRLSALTSVASSGHSLLASDGRNVIRLDANLREYASYDVGTLHGPESTTVLALLDSSHVLVQSYQDAVRLDVVALDTLDMKAVDDTQWLGYDRATHVAAFSSGTSVRFRSFDAGAGAFGPAAEVKVESFGTSVAFTDGGAFVTTYTKTGYVSRTVTRIHPERGTLTVSRPHKQPFSAPTEEVLGPGPPPFWRTVKSPDGTLAARLGANRLSLRDANGNVKWTVPASGVYSLEWLQSGELIAIGSGLARIDVETGAFGERRCGWEYGLWPQPFGVLAQPTICDAE